MGRKNKGTNSNEPTGNETGEELELGTEGQEAPIPGSQELLEVPGQPTLADALSPDEVAALKDVQDNAPVAIPTAKEGEFIAAGEGDDLGDDAGSPETPAEGDGNAEQLEQSDEQPDPADAPAPEPTPEIKDEPEAAENANAEPAEEPDVTAAEPVSPEVATAGEKAEQAPVAEEPATESNALTKLRAKYKGDIEGEGDLAWDYATLALFDEKRVVPNRTTNGQWPVDVRRTGDMGTWSDKALLDWANGEIKAPNGVSAETLHDELYQRYRLPGNWTEEAAIEFINTGKKPEETANGLLVEDRARNSSPLHHWSFQELRAAALGEINALGNTVSDVVKALRKRIGLTSTTSDEKIINSLKDNKSEVSMDNTLLEAKLEEIKAVLGKTGGNLTPKTLAEAQTVLYRTIREVMAREPENFHEGWLKLSTWVNVNYNVMFTAEKARRGWSQINLPTASLNSFDDLLTLLIRTRNPATRVEDAKIYNVEHILRHVTSEKERQNVLGFYASSY